MKLVTTEREEEMRTAKAKDHERSGGDEQGGEAWHAWLSWGLTFDMSGGAKGAKRPLGRPLDGGVRRHVAT